MISNPTFQILALIIAQMSPLDLPYGKISLVKMAWTTPSASSGRCYFRLASLHSETPRGMRLLEEQIAPFIIRMRNQTGESQFDGVNPYCFVSPIASDLEISRHDTSDPAIQFSAILIDTQRHHCNRAADNLKLLSSIITLRATRPLRQLGWGEYLFPDAPYIAGILEAKCSRNRERAEYFFKLSMDRGFPMGRNAYETLPEYKFGQ